MDLLSTSLTLNLLTTTIVAPPSNASKWPMGFNSACKGLMVGRGNETGIKKVILRVGITRHKNSVSLLHIFVNYLKKKQSLFGHKKRTLFFSTEFFFFENLHPAPPAELCFRQATNAGWSRANCPSFYSDFTRYRSTLVRSRSIKFYKNVETHR